MVMTGWLETLMLFAFFIAGSVATKYSSKVLQRRSINIIQPVGKDYTSSEIPDLTQFVSEHTTNVSDAKHGRDLWQVLCTGGVPALICFMQFFPSTAFSSWQMYYIGFLACACGDTMASEFGVLASQMPRLITTMEEVSF